MSEKTKDTEISPRGVLLALITRKPWLIPFIYYIYTYSGLRLNELKELMNLKTLIIRRALWWLTKYGIMEKSGEKYIVAEKYRKILEELLLNYCTTGKTHVLRIGKTYFVAIIRKTRISTYTIPSDILDKLVEMETNVQTEFTAKDLSDALGIPIKLAQKTLKLKQILSECRKK